MKELTQGLMFINFEVYDAADYVNKGPQLPRLGTKAFKELIEPKKCYCGKTFTPSEDNINQSWCLNCLLGVGR